MTMEVINIKGNPHDYHDYVFKDGKFIGAFEEMYLNVDDPWYRRGWW